jgi:hypothetical protein
MSNLSQFIGGGGAAGGLSPKRFLEPCFTTYGQDGGTSWGGTFVYDHNLNLVAHRKRGNGYGPGGTSQFTDWGGSEFGEQFYWAARTQNDPGSSSDDRGNGTSCASLVGDRGLTISNNGEFTWHHPGRKSQSSVGTWVHNRTPDVSIFNDNSEQWIGPRSYRNADCTGGMSYGEAYTGMWNARNINSNDRHGTQGYNELTKKFVIMESDGSYNHRITVWSNVESPSTLTDSSEFYGATNMDDSTQVQSGWFTSRPTNQDTEDNYRGVVVMCDNGDVVVSKMIPHWGFYTMKFTWDESTNSYTVPTGTEWQDSWTTSYGYANGQAFGIRHNVSMDGKYVWAYSAAYYYNSGHYMTVTRVSDGKMLHSEWKGSSQGCFFIPWRDSSMLYGVSHNADGDEGMYAWANDFDDLFERHNNNTVNWGIENHRLYRTFDTAGHSTNYPAMKQMMNQDFYAFLGDE